LVIVEDFAAPRPRVGLGDPITIGIDRRGVLPKLDAGAFDILLTSGPDAPSPWISCSDLELDSRALSGAVTLNPVAATILADTLRLGDGLAFDAALWVESLAYSTLLGGAEFRRWRSCSPRRGRDRASDPVRLELDDRLEITLDDPASRNALSAGLRDALVDALTLPLLDPSIRSVTLEGVGPAFSSGGHLDEFGSAGDLAAAHRIRTGHSVARLIDALGPRLVARVHGGLEIAAASPRLEARAGTRFCLPEVAMGLIPGAGGTASLPRRIGRHRTAFLALTGRDIDVETALAWGLIDGLWSDG
jgi:hypothetical protein